MKPISGKPEIDVSGMTTEGLAQLNRKNALSSRRYACVARQWLEYTRCNRRSIEPWAVTSTCGMNLRLPPIEAESERTREAPGEIGARSSAPGVSIQLTVNGTSRELTLDPRSSLLDILRERFAL